MPLARRFFQICLSIASETVARHGLTALQYAALPYLSRKTGDPGIDQGGLAARLGVDRNNTSLLVDQLVAKGLVDRRVKSSDRRTHALFLTAKGEKLFARMQPIAQAANRRILAPLEPPEQEVLLDLLVRVVKGNWEHARPGAGRRKRAPVRSKPASIKERDS
jgi:DNA-binding MarR family transcriptional regulator